MACRYFLLYNFANRTTSRDVVADLFVCGASKCHRNARIRSDMEASDYQFLIRNDHRLDGAVVLLFYDLSLPQRYGRAVVYIPRWRTLAGIGDFMGILP